MLFASHLAYGTESDETYTWIASAPETLFRDFPRIKIVKQLDPQSFVVSIPRYQEFTDRAIELAKRDVRFVQIAGNDEVMITVVVPKSWRFDLPPEDAHVLFIEEILTQPGVRRIAFESPVHLLAQFLRGLASENIKIEHIYDY
jgi:hypothetical protein